MKSVTFQQTGVFHQLNSTSSMDYVSEYYSLNGKIGFICLCDGSSSAMLGSVGRRIASETALKFAVENYVYGCFESDEFREDLVYAVKDALKIESLKYGRIVTPTDLNTTLSLVILDAENNAMNFVSLGTEGVFTLNKNGVLKMYHGYPEENSICSENSCRSISVTHNLDELKAVFIASDGFWKKVYQGSSLTAPFDEYLSAMQLEKVGDMISQMIFYDDRTLVAISL